jgi:hypothetical protein
MSQHVYDAEQMIIDRLTELATVAETDANNETTYQQLFKTISNPSLIAGLTEIWPLLPACFVMPGAADIASQLTNGTGVVEEQEWHLIIIVEHQASKNDDKLTEAVAGELLQACIKALSGWLPPGKNFFRPFIYAGRAEPEYNLGYAEFPLTFKIRKIVIA